MPTPDTYCDAGVTLEVVSNAAGRMRVRFCGIRFDATLAVAVEDAVAAVSGVHAVRAYPRTGSVVIWYSARDGVTAAILAAIAGSKREPRTPVSACAPYGWRSQSRRIAESYRLVYLDVVEATR